MDTPPRSSITSTAISAFFLFFIPSRRIPEVRFHAQRHAKGSGIRLSGRLHRDRQRINDVKVLGALQSVQESDDAFVIASDRSIESKFDDVSARKLLRVEGERNHLQSGLLRESRQFVGDG